MPLDLVYDPSSHRSDGRDVFSGFLVYVLLLLLGIASL